MVLADLGRRLRDAIGRLRHTTINEEELNRLLREICASLIESDVHISLVNQLRESVK